MCIAQAAILQGYLFSGLLLHSEVAKAVIVESLLRSAIHFVFRVDELSKARAYQAHSQAFVSHPRAGCGIQQPRDLAGGGLDALRGKLGFRVLEDGPDDGGFFGAADQEEDSARGVEDRQGERKAA